MQSISYKRYLRHKEVTTIDNKYIASKSFVESAYVYSAMTKKIPFSYARSSLKAPQRSRLNK